MKMLVFYPYVPWPLDRGTFQRTFHLLRALAADHEVDFVALAENGEGMEHAHVFEAFCKRVEFIPFKHPRWQRLLGGRLWNPLPSNIAHWTSDAVRERLADILSEGKYEHVHVCDIALAQYFTGEKRTERLSVDRSRVDLQFQLMEHRTLGLPLRTKWLRCESYAKLWFYERLVSRRAALQVVCGPDDEVFVRKNIRKRTSVEVVGNGVDLSFFRPDATQNEPAIEPTVLFCGAMDYSPNVDALRFWFSGIHERVVAEIPELRVLIVGKSPTGEVRDYAKRKGVIVTGTVPDVRPYYREAWAQIVPLRIGGGTRLKIPESMAMGTPVVSTTIGAQGLDLKHGQEILLADTHDSFAAETIRILRDTSLRQQISESGLAAVRARFSWECIGAKFRNAFSKHNLTHG
jgi:glycosyltransferase involved in cell wall biosynthesis